MAFFARIRAVLDRPMVRQAVNALFAKGRYEPAITRTGAGGATIVEREEVVEGKGVLRSTTVQASLVAALTSGFAIVEQVKAGIPDAELFMATVGALIGAVTAIWRHVRSWMPTRGAPAPPR